MKRIGVEKARKRLALARQHLAAIQAARSYPEFEDAWYQFLVAANSADAILEATSIKDNISQPWFGGKIRQRKKDPLLNYMHQARNSDEHGIESVTEHVPGSIGISAIGGSLHIRQLTFTEHGIVGDFDTSNGGTPVFKHTPAHARLITVKNDKFSDSFDPPTKHLGQPLSDISPQAVAALWLAYLEDLTAESEARVT